VSPLERHGAVRALGVLERTDLALIVLDATEGMTDQDARLVGKQGGGRGRFLNHRGVGLCHLIDVVDRRIDLLQPCRLLVGRSCNRLHVRIDLSNIGLYLRQRATRRHNELDARGNFMGRS